MPLLKRYIEPAAITRTADGRIPTGINNELEYTANSTRANLIRQLGSLSQHAEDMFRELFLEATSIFERTRSLSDKVDILKESVQQYDPNQVVVTLTDITKKKMYKTDYHTDQQICTRNTLPVSLRDMYMKCAPPPRLDRFDVFRNDDKPSIKTYTNPDYFFQLWIESIQKNVVEDKRKAGDRKIKKRPSNKRKGKEIVVAEDREQRFQVLSKGKEFVPTPQKQDPPVQQQPEQVSQSVKSMSNGTPGGDYVSKTPDSHPEVSKVQYPPAPHVSVNKPKEYQEMIYASYQPTPPAHNNASLANRHMSLVNSPSMNRMTVPPPPPPPVQAGSSVYEPYVPAPPPDLDIVPPPPDEHESIFPRPPSPPPKEEFVPAEMPVVKPSLGPKRLSVSQGISAGPVPAPPPPPPPPGMGGPPAPPPPPPTASIPGPSQRPNADQLTDAAAGLKSVQSIPKPAPIKDERSELLSQIKLGIQLKNAEERKINENKSAPINKGLMGGAFDVQAILDRVQEIKRAMQDSDSESDSDSDEWNDDS